MDAHLKLTPRLLAACAVALVAAALAVAALATTSTAESAAGTPDPMEFGSYVVNRVDYDEGTTLVGGLSQTTVYPQALLGSIHFPSGATGPRPVIIFLHGRHVSCAIVGIEAVGQPCPDTPFTASIDSYKGYDYMAANLASHGYVVMSIDANGVNSYDQTSGDAGALARAQTIAKSLDLLAEWNAGPGPGSIDTNLVGKVDLTHIGMMGHSRGGEGVTAFIDYNRTRPATVDPTSGNPDAGPRYPGLKAVFALAPIDAADQAPTGVHFATLLPLCDGDVSTLAGNEAYERTKANPLNDRFARAQYNVVGANHNFFNTIWVGDDESTTTDDDCAASKAGNIRLTKSAEKRIGLVLMPAFLRRFVGDETGFDPYVTGAAPLLLAACEEVVVTCDEAVQVSYRAPAAQRHAIVQPSGASPAAVAADGGAITATGFTAYGACEALEAGTGCPGNGQTQNVNRSMTRQLTLVWDAAATLRVALSGASADASPYGTLMLRGAANYNDTARNPRRTSQDFDVTLVDAAGQRATVNARPFARGALVPSGSTTDAPEVVLGGIRIPLSQFAGVDLAHLTAVELGFGARTPKGSIQLADIDWQEPPAPAAPTGPTGPTGQTGTTVTVTTPGPTQTTTVTTPGPTETTTVTTPGDTQTTTTTVPGPTTTSTVPGPTVTVPGPATTTATSGGCRDTLTPVSRFTAASTRATRRTLRLRGSSRDRGCGRLQQVRVAVAREVGKRCRFLRADRTFGPVGSCLRVRTLPARGLKTWTFSRTLRLAPGRYKAFVRGTDVARNVEPLVRTRSVTRFRVR